MGRKGRSSSKAWRNVRNQDSKVELRTYEMALGLRRYGISEVERNVAS
jgi:hypothetical protein